MERPIIVPIPLTPQLLAGVLWSTAFALGALLVSEVFRLLTEMAKRKKQEQEQLPVLLGDLDTLGQDTVYRQTVAGTTEDATKDLKSELEKNKKKGSHFF
uniref:DUF1049 domain-containing protein n=1 Tax=Ascaris lumbricoides TaxID=6252 RepID=A0A0M3HT51_ASCLU